MRELSSLNRDWNCVPCIGRQILFFCFKLFIFVLGYSWLTRVVIASDEQWRDSTVYICVSYLLQTPFPSSLSQNIEQSFLCSIVGPCWLPMLTRAWVHVHLKLSDYPFPPSEGRVLTAEPPWKPLKSDFFHRTMLPWCTVSLGVWWAVTRYTMEVVLTVHFFG